MINRLLIAIEGNLGGRDMDKEDVKEIASYRAGFLAGFFDALLGLLVIGVVLWVGVWMGENREKHKSMTFEEWKRSEEVVPQYKAENIEVEMGTPMSAEEVSKRVKAAEK